eukprot:gene15457-32676_t
MTDHATPTSPKTQPLFITMHSSGNVAIVANDGGLPAGTRNTITTPHQRHTKQGTIMMQRRTLVHTTLAAIAASFATWPAFAQGGWPT